MGEVDLVREVDGPNSGVVERRTEERARRVRLMVLDEQNPVGGNAKRVAQAILDPELVEQPGGDRLPEHSGGFRDLLKGVLEDAVELDERFFEEGDVVHLRAVDGRLIEAELDRAAGKPE